MEHVMICSSCEKHTQNRGHYHGPPKPYVVRPGAHNYAVPADQNKRPADRQHHNLNEDCEDQRLNYSLEGGRVGRTGCKAIEDRRSDESRHEIGEKLADVRAEKFHTLWNSSAKP